MAMELFLPSTTETALILSITVMGHPLLLQILLGRRDHKEMLEFKGPLATMAKMASA
jgi:hypothetical protein